MKTFETVSAKVLLDPMSLPEALICYNLASKALSALPCPKHFIHLIDDFPN